MTDKMREQFERRFPLPPGVFWHSVQNTYVGEAGWKLATDRWEAWQESRAAMVEGGSVATPPSDDENVSRHEGGQT